MVSYFVRYDGQAISPNLFLEYYRTKHASILNQFDEIRGLTIHTPVEWRDPFPIQKGGASLLAQMHYDSIEALNLSLASEARRRARTDFQNFPKFGGQIIHQALNAEQIF